MKKIIKYIRIKAIFVIVITILVIILFSNFTGIYFTKNNIEKSQEADLLAVADIIDHYISSEIEILRLKATYLVSRLMESKETEWLGILEYKETKNSEIIGISVFNADKETIVSTGRVPATPDILDNKYVRRALKEKRNGFTSTIPVSSDVGKREVVFYFTIPFQESDDGNYNRFLVFTLSGMHLKELVTRFTIWETGHILLCDAEGNIIASMRENWIMDRNNFINLAKNDSQFDGIASVIKRAISGETGVGYFTFSDLPRLCAFRPVRVSDDGWCLGVVAYLTESRLNNINKGLLMVGLISFLLSVIAAIIASGFINKPFEEVAVLKEMADVSSKSKSDFLASMSHEMRTPLNAVIGLSGLTLENKELDEETRIYLEKISDAGTTLLNIVNDILDISKIEAGKLELIPNKYDIPSLINDTITQNILRIGDKPIEFILNISPNLPNYLYGDELRIKQVLSNLLSNAFKYTNSGTVELGMQCECGNDDKTVWVTAWVKDTGKGISPEDISKLFSDYSQVDKKANRKIEGTGLGLSLTKKMLELMDGTITVDSEYGKGSVFTVRFKQKYVSSDPIGETVVNNLKNFQYLEHKRKTNSRLVYIKMPYAKILIVDDHITNLDVAKGLLKPYKMQVDFVTSGQQAIDVIIEEKTKYDAIFMDHMMPGMDGIEAVQRIRKIGTDYAKNVPIIALTANAIVGNVEMFLNSGFQDFISKPINIMQLDLVIKRWVRDKLKEKRLSSEFTKEIREMSVDMPEIPGLDVRKGLDMLAGNVEVYLSILRSYVQNTPAIIEKLRNVTAGTLPQYAIDIHGIKGSSACIGADDIRTRGSDLEMKSKAGDLQGVLELNDAFLNDVETIIGNIGKWFAEQDVKTNKTRLKMPDRVILDKLYKSLVNYDIGAIDSIMDELDSVDYELNPGFIQRLKEKITSGDFDDAIKSILEVLDGGQKNDIQE